MQEADEYAAQAQRAPTQPINPAASPTKPPADALAPAAPACRTVLLPALDNVEAPAASSSGAGQPRLLAWAGRDQDEGAGTQEINPGRGPLEAPHVALLPEQNQLAAAPRASAEQSQGQLEQESQGIFSAHLQHTSPRTGSTPPGTVSSKGNEGRSAAVPLLASMHSNPLAESDPGPADSVAAADGIADEGTGAATESFSPMADRPAADVPGATSCSAVNGLRRG